MNNKQAATQPIGFYVSMNRFTFHYNKKLQKLLECVAVWFTPLYLQTEGSLPNAMSHMSHTFSGNI